MARRPKGESLTALVKPYTGYAKRAALALFQAFPKWREYAEPVPNRYKDDTSLRIVVPDPVEGRGNDLQITTEYGGDELLVTFDRYGSHAHWSKWRNQTEEAHFEESIQYMRHFLDEETIYWRALKQGQNSGTGGYGPVNDLERTLEFARRGDADTIAIYSWRGTHDKVIELTKDTNNEPI